MLNKKEGSKQKRPSDFAEAMPKTLGGKLFVAVFCLSLCIGILILQSGFGTLGYTIYLSLIAYAIGNFIDVVVRQGKGTPTWFASLKVRANRGETDPQVQTFWTNPYVVGLSAYCVAVTYALIMATWVVLDPRAAQDWITTLRPVTEPLVALYPVLFRVADECAGLACAERIGLYRHMLPMGAILIVPFVIVPLLSWRRNFIRMPLDRGIWGYGSIFRQAMIMIAIVFVVLVLMALSHSFLADANLIDPVPPTAGRGSFGLDMSDYAYSGLYMTAFFPYFVGPMLCIWAFSQIYRLVVTQK